MCMRYMHTHTHTCTCVHPYTCEMHGSAQSLGRPNDTSLFSDVRTRIIWRRSSNGQATTGIKKDTGILIAANSRPGWRDPGRWHGSPQPRAGPLGPVGPGRMTNWGRRRQCDAEGRGRFSYRHCQARAQSMASQDEVRCVGPKFPVRR